MLLHVYCLCHVFDAVAQSVASVQTVSRLLLPVVTSIPSHIFGRLTFEHREVKLSLIGLAHTPVFLVVDLVWQVLLSGLVVGIRVAESLRIILDELFVICVVVQDNLVSLLIEHLLLVAASHGSSFVGD